MFDEYHFKDKNRMMKISGNFFSRVSDLFDLLNKQNIADEVGVSAKTIDSWLSILEKTGLIYILEPYYSNHLTRAIKTPKIYFKDTGLACYLTRWTTPEALENGAMAGHMFETFVVNEIIKSFKDTGITSEINNFIKKYDEELADGIMDIKDEFIGKGESIMEKFFSNTDSKIYIY